MSKTVLSELNGFTPAPDVLVKHYGMMTAVVFGVVWRYCQMKDGVCRASLESIAIELNLGRRSVIRHLRVLVSGGFLEDTTPGLRNRPHIYADTGKVVMVSRMEAAEKGVPESQAAMTESHDAMTESQGTLTESQSHSDTESLEDSIKIAVKIPVKITTTTSSTIFKIYEQGIGERTTVSANDTGGQPVSGMCKTVSDNEESESAKAKTLSAKDKSVSARLILNQINQSNQNNLNNQVYQRELFSKAKCKELTGNMNLGNQIFDREIEDPSLQGHARELEQMRLTREKIIQPSRFDAPGWRGFDEWLPRQ